MRLMCLVNIQPVHLLNIQPVRTPDTKRGRLCEQLERVKARIRAKVEHPFHIVKNILGLKKVRYRGLFKNTAQLFTLFALANLLIAKRQLFALHAQGAS